MPTRGTRLPAADLLQLVYVSAAVPTLTADNLDRIAEASARRNESAGLTGLLLHQGASFYGVLEGPRRRVFQRMEVIITDRRHFALRILRETPILCRRFENWSFGTLPRTTETVGEPEDFIRVLSRRL